jgi:hypothetical protein
MNVKVRCHYLLTPHKISGEILVAKDSTGHYFMCPPAGSSTEREEDSPAPPAPNQPRDRGRSPLRPRWRHARQQASWDLLLPSPGVSSFPPGVAAQLDPGARGRIYLAVSANTVRIGCADRSIPCSIYVHCSGCGTFFNLATRASHTTSARGLKAQNLH